MPEQFSQMTISELAAFLKEQHKITPALEEALLHDGRKGALALLERYQRQAEREAAEITRLQKMLYFENQLWEKGMQHICGLDEAGRGPLAGPVVAAAVIFKPGTLIEKLNDSKKLTAAKREALFDEIILNALAYGIGSATREEIDEHNIHQATFLAMRRALAKLNRQPDYLLLDGFPLPDAACPQRAIPGGDSRSLTIAAASILAKVTRDKMMFELHQRYPQYGFNRHKGYGTEEHCRALCQHGPCPAHRQSFRLDYND